MRSATPWPQQVCRTLFLRLQGACVDALYMTRTRPPTTGGVMHAAVCTHRAAEAADIIAVVDLLLDAGEQQPPVVDTLGKALKRHTMCAITCLLYAWQMLSELVCCTGMVLSCCQG